MIARFGGFRGYSKETNMGFEMGRDWWSLGVDLVGKGLGATMQGVGNFTVAARV